MVRDVGIIIKLPTGLSFRIALTSVLAVIAMSPASTFGKIMMCIFETLVEAIKCLEESKLRTEKNSKKRL